MKIYSLQVNHLNKPIGIGGEKVRLNWKISDCKKQNGFRVVVYDIEKNVVEDSEKISTGETFYSLKNDLLARSKYKVMVSCYDENDIECEPAEIEIITGIRGAEFQAKWINPELTTNPGERKRGAYLIKEFDLSKEQVAEGLKSAYIYATCHGIMNIYLNGKEVTDYQLMPGTQQYNKRLMVETLPVGDFLVEGKNSLVVTLGDGWYRGAMGNNQEHNLYGEDIALLLQLEIDKRAIVVSDESWKATSEGPLGLNDFMKGEEYDATLSLDNTHEVKLERFGYDNLIMVDTVPILPKEEFSAIWVSTPNGEKILDFGQNIAGYVKFSFEGQAGKKLVLTHGETLDKDGNFTISNFQNQVASTDQRVTYICKDGLNEYHPTKTYMGFRYVKVEADFEVKPEWFTAVAIYSDMDVLSSFECGNELVNKLFDNALWSMKGNFIDVPTDCPTREKSGYSGDCQAYIHTAMYLMDCYSVYAKWIRENAAGQYRNGLLPQISPKDCKPNEKQKMMKIMVLDGGIGWSDAFEIILYRLNKRYGDDTLTEENYETLRRWTEYEIKRAKTTRRSNLKVLPREHRKYMIDKGWMWGEWLEPCQDDRSYMTNLILNGDPEVGTAFFYMHLTYTAEMAERLGHKEDALKYQELAKKARDAYRAVYTDNGRVIEKTRQCRFVRPIAHDLLSEEEKKVAAADLANMITENGNHLGTGFLTTHELCRALSNYGQTSKAYDVLLNEDMPGFLYAVKLGCTTIPESWDCIGHVEEGQPYNSFNHYSYGAICGWLIDSVCGIKVEDGKIIVEPKPDERLGFAKASYDSPYGLIKSEWRYADGKCSYKVTVPSGAKATIILPEGEAIEVEAGEYNY